MKTFVNEGPIDRGIRIVLGIALLIAAFLLHGVLAVVLYVLAVVALMTGILGFCLLYKIIGVNTSRRRV